MAKQTTIRTTHDESIDRGIGQRLRAFRLQRKLSQSEVGEALGVTFQQIQKYENGKNRVSGSRLVTICTLLKIKPEQLLGNGHGVFVTEPDVLEPLFADKSLLKMFIEIGQLPKHQRAGVVAAMLDMVRAFKIPRLKREAE